MGIEHRIKEECETFWKCVHCSAVQSLDCDEPKEHDVICGECGDASPARQGLATWGDFWLYCQGLKSG